MVFHIYLSNLIFSLVSVNHNSSGVLCELWSELSATTQQVFKYYLW